MCGGTSLILSYACVSTGLSPRVRGNRTWNMAALVFLGSIPACAGEPPTERLPLKMSRVYPRVCGGTNDDREWAEYADGLSPRVRGNPVHVPLVMRPNGSIPACAGEPPSRCRPAKRSPVYPRVCGGTQIKHFENAARDGLSPRVRGNLSTIRPSVSSTGSIPACAGEPINDPAISKQYRVYPRVCGGTCRAAAIP